MKPKFSIIVPLYNKSPYIRRALESIISQTISDWECIIVDDGSTDGSLNVVIDFIRNDGMCRANALNESLTLNDDRLTIISQPNSGVVAARNRGVKESMGEYVCFLDADDWWEPTWLEEMDKLIQEYPDAGLYATNYVYYKPGRTHVALNLEQGYINYPEAYLHSDAMPVWTGAACMPRCVFDEMGGFPVGIKLGEDFLLWAKTALHYKVAYGEKPLAYYNNDVPASLRATRNLHAPEHHMLFHLNELERIINYKFQMTNDQLETWKCLFDKLRVSGLMSYWLSDEYHDVAAEELKKVDWRKQPKKVKAQYKKPRWLLRAKKHFMQMGSAIKQSLISWRNAKNVQWYIFALMALVIIVKNILFNWICFSAAQEDFFMFLLLSLPQKIVPALLISSFVFITKRPIWTIVANLMIDIWLIANLFYFKANGYMLSYEVMTMVDNMSGFWSSLQSYIGWDIVVFPFITLVYAILIPYTYSRSKKYWITIIIIVIGLLINIGDQILHKMHKVAQGKESVVRLRDCLPFSHVYTYADAEWVDYNYWSKGYVNKYSIVSYFPACLLYRYLAPIKTIEMIDIDENRLKPFLSDRPDAECKPKTNLVFILVESLESWPLDSICGMEFMPNLNAIIKDEHVLCCPRLKPQVVHGNSADGQLIDMTGLLPITDGIVCNSFYNNTYPSLAQSYDYSAIINPSPGVWKQDQMTKAYHFGELIEPKQREKWQDEDVSNHIINYIDTACHPFCLLGITISSHVPFTYGASNPKYEIGGMPAQMNAYLNCMAYVDSCIGVLYRHIRSSEELATSTTLVITGDHTIFRSYNKEMDTYAQKEDINFQTTKTYTPLIVYSPLLTRNTQIEKTCNQMDIYPTVLNLTGCADYYWKGFGVNLADTAIINNRPISEEEAYELSNMLIRSDWFSGSSLDDKVAYIAHAGGSINGCIYTNSLEAVEHALSCGVRYIELDLCLTTDSVIVAAHDWEHFHEITGNAGDTMPISLAEFSSRKIFDKYTPITYTMIEVLMERYPDMYLVTDKISSPNILRRFTHKDRIVVEALSVDDYFQLDTMGFYKVFCSCNPKTKYKEAFYKSTNLLRGRLKESVPTRYVFGCRSKSEDYGRLYGEEFAIYTVKNKAEADSIMRIDRRIRYVYIDEVE